MLSADQLACISATVEASLDQSLTLSRDTFTSDTSGHQKIASTATSTIKCNVLKPTASQLQTYAGKIGSQRSLVLRVMPSTDIREGDRVDHNGLTWLVNGVMDAASYSVSNQYLIVAVN